MSFPSSRVHEAVTASSDITHARKNLILTLLEDRHGELTALHAEVLLRWRSSTQQSSTQGHESLGALQPTLLRQALAEDAACGHPVIITNGQGLGPDSAPGWGECTLQLQLPQLAALLGLSAAEVAPRHTASNSLGLGLHAHPKPRKATAPDPLAACATITETEAEHSPSSSAKQAHEQSSSAAQPLPRPLIQGAPEPCSHSPRSHPVAAPPGITSEWDAHADHAGAAARGSLSAPLPVPAVQGGHGEQTDASAAAPTLMSRTSADAQLQQVAQDLPKAAQQPAQYVYQVQPVTVAVQSHSQPLSYNAPPHTVGMNIPSQEWMQASTSSNLSLPVMEASGLLHMEPASSRRSSLMQLSSHNSEQLSRYMSASASLVQGMSTPSSSQIFTNHPSNLVVIGTPSTMPVSGSAAAPPQSPGAATPNSSTTPNHMAGVAESQGSRELPRMDLDTALEALIHYEAGADGPVSAATAAAAQSTIQQHVAAQLAVVRAAANRVDLNRRSADGFGGSSGQATEPNSGSNVTQGVPPVAAASNTEAPPRGPPTMTSLVQAANDAESAYGSDAQPYSSISLDPSTGSYAVDPHTLELKSTDRHSSPPVLTGAVPAVSAPLQPHRPPVRLSLSAPRGSTSWAAAQGRPQQTVTMAGGQPQLITTSGGNIVQLQQLDGSAPQLVTYAQPLSARHAGGIQAAQPLMLATNVMGGRNVTTVMPAGVTLQPPQPQIIIQQPGTVAQAVQLEQVVGNTMVTQVAPGHVITGPPRLWHQLSPNVRAQVQHVLSNTPGIQGEDLDDNVLRQLLSTMSITEEVVLAEPQMQTVTVQDLSGKLHRVQAYVSQGGDKLNIATLAPGGMLGIRTSSALPAAAKAALQKLPPRVLARLEELVSRCTYMDLKHFDAGVVKVMLQLCELSEADVLEELQLLEATDLSNVEYMPAYLNKRLNNRLWNRRKVQQQVQQQQPFTLILN